MSPPRRLPAAVLLLPVLVALLLAAGGAGGTEILAKSIIETCARDVVGDGGGSLSCEKKLVLDVAVPSGSSGGEASIVVKVDETEENGTQATMRVLRDPPVITINKSAVYAAYALTYLWDVAYKPEELVVQTRKCEPDAGADVVGSCERLRNENGSVIEHSEPVCCPCGERRFHTSCGNFITNMIKGKPNNAHCVRFPGDWYHVFHIGTRSIGFSIRVQVRKGSSVSEVIVGPDNTTVVSGDNFLRVNLVGDYAGFQSVPLFENSYLVTPRKGAGSGQPQDLGDQYSRWMVVEKLQFTYDGLECDKIGVGYEAFQNQPDFCSLELGSCLKYQLWNLMEEDKSLINRSLPPHYVVEGRFERINQHPNAGPYSFSVGVTEVLKTNLRLELSADDVQYVYQRSPGKIISIKVPPFEALSQVGAANVTTRNIGKLEASYSLALKCDGGIDNLQEQFFIMKPDEATSTVFDLRTSTNEAVSYRCTAILKSANYSELDRVEVRFNTTATVLNNGTQIGPPKEQEHKKGGPMVFFEDVRDFLLKIWDSVINIFNGIFCRFYFWHICIGWMVMVFGLIFALVAAPLWYLHQKGFFDPLHDWCVDRFGMEPIDGAQGARRAQEAELYAMKHLAE